MQELLQDIDLIMKNNICSNKEQRKAICSLLKQRVFHYDWVGVYCLDDDDNTLALDVFDGKPTEHTRIQVGNGVCGQVAQSGEAKIVQDVSKEGNYIACSIDVQSEIVVPILRDGKFIAEIDIDSHSSAPFTEEDLVLLENVAKYFEKLI